MNPTRLIAASALAVGLVATGCSAGGRTPTTVITVAPAPAPTQSALASTLDLPHLTLTDPINIKTTSDDDPAGSTVAIAIRYLNDLRAQWWHAALNQMAYVERTGIGFDGTAGLVGRDVLRNASGGSGRLARCTSGHRFASDAVIVRCGGSHVVVHVETLRGFRGVQVSEFLVAGDHPGQPHTHAYSRLV